MVQGGYADRDSAVRHAPTYAAGDADASAECRGSTGSALSLPSREGTATAAALRWGSRNRHFIGTECVCVIGFSVIFKRIVAY